MDVTLMHPSLEATVHVLQIIAAILQVVANMFGEACKERNDAIRGAVGEITNMICGDARRSEK
jgi:CheY-specific phosphatase CheX